MHHNIPFFVAAPLTSIDLSLSSGEEIVIEERSPKELLNSRGGLGEQVAASGIAVWNPAFDVTPAHLISGIITEKVIISIPLSCLEQLRKYPTPVDMFYLCRESSRKWRVLNLST